MKILAFWISAMAMLLLSCSEEVRNIDNMDLRNNIIYEKDSETPYTGKVIAFYKKGQKEYEKNYENGKLNGITTIWYKNGQIFRKIEFIDGERVVDCSPSAIDYLGKTYNTVQIGDQCWFAENLNIGTKINSTTSGFQQTDNGTIEKYCYNNNEANCETYGGLYEWTEAMQYVTTEGTQGICPTGWHIPTKGEYETLQTEVSNEAVKLMGQSQTMNGYTATNETGFSALFAGRRYYSNGSFHDLSNDTYFWSSTENGSYAYNLYLYCNNSDVYFGNRRKYYGFSVRCLKD